MKYREKIISESSNPREGPVPPSATFPPPTSSHQSHRSINQSGALSLVESLIELKYFHGVATPALLCHKEPARISDDHDLGPDLGSLQCSTLL